MVEGMEKISLVIGELVDGGTFTKDALKRMQDALSTAKALEKERDETIVTVKQLRAQVAEKDRRIEEFEGAGVKMLGREKAVTEREAKVTELEKSAAVARAEASVYSQCFDKVFRNFSVNKSITKNVVTPNSTPGGWPQTTSITDTENESIF